MRLTIFRSLGLAVFLGSSPMAVAQPAPSPPVATMISDAPLLAELDRDKIAPLSLYSLFKRLHEARKLTSPAPVAASGPTRASDLTRFGESYGKFTSVMSADIARMISELGIDWEKEILKTYVPSAAKTEAGKRLRQNGNVMRVFNEKWLNSSDGLFILAGVVNRIDRRDFDPGHCGEVRFIYRLGYDVKMNGKTYASRMPFTVNMVFSYNDDGDNCRGIATRWRVEGMGKDSAAVIAQRLLQGPLDFSKLTFKQMEINAQVARFPSDLERMENRRLAGQAIYWMRIFAFRDEGFRPIALENTPDVQAILKAPAKQKQLQDYLSAHMREIDTGAFKIPDELSADIALSYSTAGSARLANRPFDLVVSPELANKMVNAWSDPSRQFIRTGAALLERLNTSSCMGCHQSSSTAGFHFLGVDRSDFGDAAAVQGAIDGNRLQLPFSPHVSAELPRRQSYVEHLTRGEAPDRFRPHPSAPAADWDEKAVPITAAAGDNMPCPLSADLATEANWSCSSARGLTCQAMTTNGAASFHLGQCVPAQKNIYAGLSCRANVIADATPQNASGSRLSFNVRSFSDRVTKEELIYKVPEGKLSGYDNNCRPSQIGVPLGRLSRPCTPEEARLAAFLPGKAANEICAIVGGKGFEQMAKGYFDSAAFAASVGRGMLDTCSPTRFCREDYICQAMPEDLTRGAVKPSAQALNVLKTEKIGFCTPTYFVYQLRLDGHPNPK